MPVISFVCVNANSGKVGRWYTSRTSILVIGLFLYETALRGEDQREVHVTHCWGKLIEGEGLLRMDRAAAWDIAWRLFAAGRCLLRFVPSWGALKQ